MRSSNMFRQMIRRENGFCVRAYGANTTMPVYTVEEYAPNSVGKILHSCGGTHGRENAFKRFRYLAYGTPYRYNTNSN